MTSANALVLYYWTSLTLSLVVILYLSLYHTCPCACSLVCYNGLSALIVISQNTHTHISYSDIFHDICQCSCTLLLDKSDLVVVLVIVLVLVLVLVA